MKSSWPFKRFGKASNYHNYDCDRVIAWNGPLAQLVQANQHAPSALALPICSWPITFSTCIIHVPVQMSLKFYDSTCLFFCLASDVTEYLAGYFKERLRDSENAIEI